MNEDKMIKVWRWDDAPQEYRALSRHAGDEDYIALVPAALAHDPPIWLDVAPFTIFDVETYPLGDGSIIYISAHG
jgi:hypothetical protein